MYKLLAACMLVGLVASQYQDHIDRGFTARKVIVKDHQYIGFEKLIHDVNVGTNHFNLEYGFYRAEKAGMYHFTFQLISTKRHHFRVSLRVNGRPQVWALAQRNYHHAGNAATLALNEGDVVYLFLEEGAIHEPHNSYRGYGTFSGHRISYDENDAVIPRGTAQRISSDERKEIDNYGNKLPSAWKN